MMYGHFFLSVFISISCCAVESYFSTNEYVGLSLATKRWYHSECILIVNLEAFSYVPQVNEFNKALSKTIIFTSNVNAQILNQTANNFKCRGNKPMYILIGFKEGQDISRLIYKLPSYPRWLILLDSTQTTKEVFQNMYVPFNCEVLVARKFGSEIKLTEVYQVAEEFPLNERPFGNWSQNEGLNATKLSLYERRRDLEGVTIKAIGMEFAPETLMTRDSNHNILVHGLYGEVWRLLENRLNFKTFVINSTDNYAEFGALVNGTWRGLVANVFSGEVDVVLNAMTYQNERMDAVGFLSPITHSRVNLIVRKPTGVRFQWTSFLSPFDSSLWLVVLASILLSGGLLASSYNVGSRGRGDSQSGEDECRIGSAAFHVFGLYCSQGTPLSPRAVSSRTVLLLAGLTSTVVVAAYSGALTSFITVQKLDLPYETIQEYVDDPKYQLEMSPSAFWLYLKNPRNNLYRALYQRMIDGVNDMPSNWWLGVEKMCQSKSPYGWIAQYHFVDRLARENNCDFVAVPNLLLTDTESIIVSEGFPYVELFNHNLQHMRVSGILQHIYREAWPDPLSKLDTTLPSVQLYQVVPILVVLAAGIVASLVCIIAESFLRSYISSSH